MYRLTDYPLYNTYQSANQSSGNQYTKHPSANRSDCTVDICSTRYHCTLNKTKKYSNVSFDASILKTHCTLLKKETFFYLSLSLSLSFRFFATVVRARQSTGKRNILADHFLDP